MVTLISPPCFNYYTCLFLVRRGGSFHGAEGLISWKDGGMVWLAEAAGTTAGGAYVGAATGGAYGGAPATAAIRHGMCLFKS